MRHHAVLVLIVKVGQRGGIWRVGKVKTVALRMNNVLSRLVRKCQPEAAVPVNQPVVGS